MLQIHGKRKEILLYCESWRRKGKHGEKKGTGTGIFGPMREQGPIRFTRTWISCEILTELQRQIWKSHRGGSIGWNCSWKKRGNRLQCKKQTRQLWTPPDFCRCVQTYPQYWYMQQTVKERQVESLCARTQHKCHYILVTWSKHRCLIMAYARKTSAMFSRKLRLNLGSARGSVLHQIFVFIGSSMVFCCQHSAHFAEFCVTTSVQGAHLLEHVIA